MRRLLTVQECGACGAELRSGTRSEWRRAGFGTHELVPVPALACPSCGSLEIGKARFDDGGMLVVEGELS